MIAHLLGTYGYLFLGILIAVESFGIPLPGETGLVTAAAYAATGHLNILLVAAVAAAGAIVGDNAGYQVGRRGGIALVRRYGAHVGLDQGKLDRAHAFFDRHGAKTVFIGRFVALLRSWAAALAGVACMPYRTFMLWNALGGITWAALFAALGYAFGRNLPLLHRYVAQVSVAAVLLGTLGLVVFLLHRHVNGHSNEIADDVTSRWQRVARAPLFAGIRTRYPRLWTFFAARLARGEYLGLHLTVGLVVSVAALWLFGGVTEDVIHHDPITAVDLHVATWLRAHATPLGDRIAIALSLIGSPLVVGLVGLAVCALLLFHRRWLSLAGWLIAFVGAALLDVILKDVIRRPRPLGAGAFLHGTSFSFPSGHAMGSLVSYGMLAWLAVTFWGPARRHRTAVVVMATTLIVSIGLSRLYLAVHFVSDVIGGFAAGTVWLAACVTGLEIALRQRGLGPWDVGVDRRSLPRDATTTGMRRAGPAG